MTIVRGRCPHCKKNIEADLTPKVKWPKEFDQAFALFDKAFAQITKGFRGIGL